MSENAASPLRGLCYIADYLTPVTEALLLEAADAHEWQMFVDHGVQVCGYHYNHGKREAYQIGQLPVWAAELARRLWREGIAPDLPNQLVVNDYPIGRGIFPHIDPDAFGDVVISVSLGSSCVMRFSPVGSGVAEEHFLERRSVIVLSGDARWNWTHEIPARAVDHWGTDERPRSRRVSLTYRFVPGPANLLA